MYKRILIAYDGSEAGQKSLLECLEVAQWGQSEFFLVAVRPPVALIAAEAGVYDAEREKEDEGHYQGILADGMQQLSSSGYKVTGEVVVGDPVDQIVTFAKKIGADLIVVGHKHLEGWAARWWRGSLSKSLIEHAPCSVLVVIIH
jgi:nucleotide-binding universal stress UspA family protein